MSADGPSRVAAYDTRWMGVAAMPRFLVASDTIDGRLIELKPCWDLMSAGAYVVWPNNVSETSLTIRFVNFLAKQLKAS